MTTSPSTTSDLSTAIVATSSATVSVTSLTGMITMRLTRENFLLWKTQAAPALRSARLFGYVDGTIVAPSATISQGTGDAAVVIANPEYLKWFQQDQTVMIAQIGRASCREGVSSYV